MPNALAIVFLLLNHFVRIGAALLCWTTFCGIDIEYIHATVIFVPPRRELPTSQLKILKALILFYPKALSLRSAVQLWFHLHRRLIGRLRRDPLIV